MAETKRKMEELLAANKIMHTYRGDNPHKVYVVGQVRSYKNELKDGTTRYVHEFRGTSTPPGQENRRGAFFRAETTQPIDLASYQDTDKLLLVSGQTFKVEYKDKEGNKRLINKTFVRSIKTAKEEEREKDGKKYMAIVGDKDVMSADIAAKNEYYAANNRSLQGFINHTQLNEPIKKNAGTENEEIIGYRQFMYVGQGKDKDGNLRPSVQVGFNTTEPLDEAAFAKGTLISMPGAVRVFRSKDKDGYWGTREMFEPNYIAKVEFERKLEKEAVPVEPDMTDEEIQDADAFVPGQDEYDEPDVTENLFAPEDLGMDM